MLRIPAGYVHAIIGCPFQARSLARATSTHSCTQWPYRVHVRHSCTTKALVRHFCLTLELKKHIGDPVLPVRGPDPTRGNVHYIDGTEFKFGPHIHDQCHRFIHTYPISVALLQAERHHHSYNLDIFSFSTTSHQKVKREMQYRPVPCTNCAPSSRLHVTTVSID